MSGSDDLIFYGIDGDECERFVAAVTQTAFQEKKLRDQAWIADLAVSGLRRNALRWYTTLDDDVQSNWRLLQKALVTQYPPTENRNQNMMMSSASSMLSEAAAAARTLAGRSSSGLSAGKEYFDADLPPRAGLVSPELTIPTPAAAPHMTSSHMWSVIRSEVYRRNLATDSPESASSKLPHQALEPLPITRPSSRLEALPTPPSGLKHASLVPSIPPDVGVIKILAEGHSDYKYVSKSYHNSSIGDGKLGGKMHGALVPTESIVDTVLVTLTPPNQYGLRAMKLRTSAKYLGLKWYEKNPDPSNTSSHECALIPLKDIGKGDESMTCKLSSLYWLGPTSSHIWDFDETSMELVPTYRNPRDGVKYPLQAILNTSVESETYSIQMVPGFDAWNKILRGIRAQLVFVPM